MNLIMRFVDICLFKAGPAEVPASHWLMKLVLVSYFITGVIVSRIESPWVASLASSFTDMLAMVLTTWLLLKLRGFLSRYLQTLSALAGAGTILSLIGIPVLLILHQVGTQSHMASIVLLCVMILMFWSLMVTAHIFRQALEIKAGTAAIITVIYTLISLIAVGLVMSGVA